MAKQVFEGSHGVIEKQLPNSINTIERGQKPYGESLIKPAELIRRNKELRVLNRFFGKSKQHDPELTLRNLANLDFSAKQNTLKNSVDRNQETNEAQDQVGSVNTLAELMSNGNKRKVTKLMNGKQKAANNEYLFPEHEKDERKQERDPFDIINEQLALSQERYHDLALTLAGAFGGIQKEGEKDEKNLTVFEMFLLLLVLMMRGVVGDTNNESNGNTGFEN